MRVLFTFYVYKDSVYKARLTIKRRRNVALGYDDLYVSPGSSRRVARTHRASPELMVGRQDLLPKTKSSCPESDDKLENRSFARPTYRSFTFSEW